LAVLKKLAVWVGGFSDEKIAWSREPLLVHWIHECFFEEGLLINPSPSCTRDGFCLLKKTIFCRFGFEFFKTLDLLTNWVIMKIVISRELVTFTQKSGILFNKCEVTKVFVINQSISIWVNTQYWVFKFK
jgi:hypothetical protein